MDLEENKENDDEDYETVDEDEEEIENGVDGEESDL
jgi:hypothetical protein